MEQLNCKDIILRKSPQILCYKWHELISSVEALTQLSAVCA